MTSNTQAVIEHRRAERLIATSGDAGRLADVERAALEFQKKTLDKKKRLDDDGYLSDEGQKTELAIMVHDWRAHAQSLIDDVIEPIERRQQKAADRSAAIPDRTPQDCEISAAFNRLTGDERTVAILAARRGDDPALARALANEPRISSTLVAGTGDLEAMQKQVTPSDDQHRQTDAADILDRAKRARETISEISRHLSGVTT